MTDISLSELAPETATEAATETATEAAAEDGQSSSDFLLEIVDRLDEKGILEPALFGPDKAQELNKENTQPVKSGDKSGSKDPKIDADKIAELGKKVIDSVGDVKMSQLVKYAEANPEEVNQLLNQYGDEI